MLKGSDGGRVYENLSLPRIGREGFALLDSDSGQLTADLGAKESCRFLLENRMHVFEEGEIVG